MSIGLTDNQKELSRRYVFYRVLTDMWFIGAVWLYFYRIFITDYQVGILDGLAFAIGLLAEVPSGALADKFGRDRMVKIGQALVACGLIITGFGESFGVFFVGQVVFMVGVSFASGADEALFFDKLKFARTSVQWRNLVTRGSQYALVGALVATVVGGWLHTVDPRMPWILTGIAFLGSVGLIWSMKDARPEKVKHGFVPEVRSYLKSIADGFAQFRAPKLWLYVPIIVIVEGLLYVAGWGILRIVLLDRFYFDPFWGSVVIALSGLITVAILAYVHKHAERISEKRMITLISLATIASLLVSVFDIGMWGFAVIVVLYTGEHLFYPFISEALNYHTEDARRATVLSIASFLRALPYVALAPIIGYLNTHNGLVYFFIVWSVLIGASLLMYLSLKKKDALIKI